MICGTYCYLTKYCLNILSQRAQIFCTTNSMYFISILFDSQISFFWPRSWAVLETVFFSRHLVFSPVYSCLLTTSGFPIWYMNFFMMQLLWCNNFHYQIYNSVYSCLFLSVPYFWTSYLIYEFLYDAIIMIQ